MLNLIIIFILIFRCNYRILQGLMNIAETSALYDYWNSQQDQDDEKERLLKLNLNEPASYLFKYEPYKWEILYQSSLRSIIKGDQSSIKGLIILLSTLNQQERNKVLLSLKEFLEPRIIFELRNQNYKDIKSSNNILRAIMILIFIFTNPYGLEIKRNHNHIYERTGMFFYKLRTIFTDSFF